MYSSTGVLLFSNAGTLAVCTSTCTLSTSAWSASLQPAIALRGRLTTCAKVYSRPARVMVSALTPSTAAANASASSAASPSAEASLRSLTPLNSLNSSSKRSSCPVLVSFEGSVVSSVPPVLSPFGPLLRGAARSSSPCTRPPTPAP